jgi:hypothetical protein
MLRRTVYRLPCNHCALSLSNVKGWTRPDYSLLSLPRGHPSPRQLRFLLLFQHANSVSFVDRLLCSLNRLLFNKQNSTDKWCSTHFLPKCHPKSSQLTDNLRHYSSVNPVWYRDSIIERDAMGRVCSARGEHMKCLHSFENWDLNLDLPNTRQER